MAESNAAITNAVLLTLLPGLQRLSQFLDTNLNAQSTVVCSDDPAEYKCLLHDTLVAPTPAAAMKDAGIAIQSFPTESRQTPGGRQDDIRRLSGQRAQPYHKNTLETFVRSEHWETLLRRIGQPAMVYLLTQTSIFAALPNNCYCQITGPAISEQHVSKQLIQQEVLQSLSTRKRPVDLTPSSVTSDTCSSKDTSPPAAKRRAVSNEKRKSEGHRLEDVPTVTKRQKKNNSDRDKIKDKVANPRAAISPSAISFQRSRIFYARRYHIESVMLRNFLLADYDSFKPVDYVPDLKAIVDIQMKRMFPKQHGLQNVFSPSMPSTGWLPDARQTMGGFKYRTERAKRKAAGGWRLRSMRTLVEEMLVLNQKCRFMALLQYYCPAIDNATESAQTNVATLLTSCSSFDQKVIPLAMFGSIDNRAVILRAMTRFIRLRKYETVPLQYALQGFKLSECEWLQDSHRVHEERPVRHIAPTASDKQHEILHEFVYWLFEGFLMPLLRATFYVTDSSYQRNKLFYYRHGLWRIITQTAVNSIQGKMFIRMEPEEVSVCNSVYSKVRFLPKTTDLRPIINLGRKAPRLVNGGSAGNYKSTNDRLKTASLVLAYERSRQIECSSAIGMSDLFHRLKKAKEKLVGSSTRNQQRLYMVKVDIKKAFDSINQENLLYLINETLKEDKYIIHRHSKVNPANGRMMKRFNANATAPDDIPHFLDFAHEQAVFSKHAVFVDKVVHSSERKDVLISMIMEHVRENVVKFGRHFYKQATGIPQGSKLSPALCSHDKDKSIEFLRIMAAGHPEFGCFINEVKTVTNFDVLLSDGQPAQQCQGNDFPYCGFLLHTKKLEIRADYTRYDGDDSANDPQHPTSAMQHMCQMSFSDTTYNSHARVFLNIYQNFIFCAMKFHAYILELFLDPALSCRSTSSSSSYSSSSSSSQDQINHRQNIIIDPSDLPEIVTGIFRAAYGLLHNSRRSKVGIEAGVEFRVYERHVFWLGATAFLKTLPERQGQSQAGPGLGQGSSRMPEFVYAPLRKYLRTKIVDRLEVEEKKAYFKRMLFSAVNDPRNSIMNDIRYR
ncbi:hypothetical protein BGZ90_003804 [Linnemannia elongata]|nr:hypothetical protein BGZ90_003804 [Linnemannia elongata]